MRYRINVLIIVMLLFLGISACVPSHKDAIIFGTNTTFAVDISLNATTQVPNLTVGYKRQEGVFLPVLANGTDSRYANYSSAMFGQKRVGTDNIIKNGVKYLGYEQDCSKEIYNEDSYSVFASFGADVLAKSGKVGVNQFFATGLAARNLAANRNISRALLEQNDTSTTPKATEQVVTNVAIAEDVAKYLVEVSTDSAGLQIQNVNTAKCQNLSNGTFLGSVADGCKKSLSELKLLIVSKAIQDSSGVEMNKLRQRMYDLLFQEAVLNTKK